MRNFLFVIEYWTALCEYDREVYPNKMSWPSKNEEKREDVDEAIVDDWLGVEITLGVPEYCGIYKYSYASSKAHTEYQTAELTQLVNGVLCLRR